MNRKEVVLLIIILLVVPITFSLSDDTGTTTQDYDAQLDACKQSPSSCDWGTLKDSDIAANSEKLSGSQWNSLGPERMTAVTKSMTKDQMSKVNLRDPQIKAAFDRMPIDHRIDLLKKLDREQRRYIIRQAIRDFFGLKSKSDYNFELSSEDMDEFKAYLAEEGITVDIDLQTDNVKIEKDADGNSILTTPDGSSIKLDSLKTGSHTISITADGVTIDGKTYKGGKLVEADASAPAGTYEVDTTDTFTYPILTDTAVSGNSIKGMTVYPNGTIFITNTSELNIKNSTNEVIIKNGANIIINPDGTYTADYIAQLRDGKLVMLNAYNVSSDGNITADKADSAIVDQSSVATTINDFYFNKDNTFAVGGADLGYELNANNNNGGYGRLTPIRHPGGGDPRLILAALLFAVVVWVRRSLSTGSRLGMAAA